LSRFRDITAFERSNPFFQHPTPIRAKISGVPLGVAPRCWGLQRANIPG